MKRPHAKRKPIQDMETLPDRQAADKATNHRRTVNKVRAHRKYATYACFMPHSRAVVANRCSRSFPKTSFAATKREENTPLQQRPPSRVHRGETRQMNRTNSFPNSSLVYCMKNCEERGITLGLSANGNEFRTATAMTGMRRHLCRNLSTQSAMDLTKTQTSKHTNQATPPPPLLFPSRS
ncbi:unnamed protein product [Ectocarpus sp. 12 AP-2014]